MRSLVRRFFVAVFALLLLFEEWGWEPLAALLARLGRLPFFAWLERRIRALPPYAALAAFFAPALLLVPIKLAALWFIAQGHGGWGLAVLVAAKIAGTALVARLFALTQPTLMQLAWFARWYPRWKGWKDRVIAEVKGSPGWQAVQRAKAAAAAQWAQFRKNLG
ncbi:hypothetical protein [Ramlibacter sp. PS4R-6]|uniref:hypothetical protein n=1 Tax=Ramlibacter sp. PS4R-6 TaxID=3133438 RepID=UPI0030A78D1E